MPVEIPAMGTRGFRPPRMPALLMSAMLGLSVAVFHWLGGKMKVQGRPVLLLHTVGAKTGKPRKTLVCWFPDEGRVDSWLVVASYAGAAQHPTWFLNLAKHPHEVSAEIDKRLVKVTAETLKGAHRAAAWERIVTLAPGYGKYQAKTDRELPIVRLVEQR